MLYIARHARNICLEDICQGRTPESDTGPEAEPMQELQAGVIEVERGGLAISRSFQGTADVWFQGRCRLSAHQRKKLIGIA
jgi:hypothetical protein